MNVETFEQLPLLGIIRGVDDHDVIPIADASMNAGLRALEITMNTPLAHKLIEKMASHCDGKMAIGAGTVLSIKDLKVALSAGARFIVMPIIEPSVLEYCNDHSIPVFPGALTPNEIYSAWNQKATMVKVFPASLFGPSYFKEIKAPLNSIKLLACGGVSTKTIADFFKNGASAAAFGASIYKKEYIEKKQFDMIEQEIRDLIAAYRTV